MNNPKTINSEEIRCKNCGGKLYRFRTCPGEQEFAHEDTYSIFCPPIILTKAEPINSVSPASTKEEK